MKYIIILLIISVQATAQDYGDSALTITATQKLSYWIGAHIKNNFQWSERNAPTQLKNYIGSGTNPDSLIVGVTFKAKYLAGALEALISQPLQVSYADYRSIVLGMPSITGYTNLVTQINAIASGNSAQKNTAAWLKDKYKERTDAYTALYEEQKQQTIEWSRN